MEIKACEIRLAVTLTIALLGPAACDKVYSSELRTL